MFILDLLINIGPKVLRFGDNDKKRYFALKNQTFDRKVVET